MPGVPVGSALRQVERLFGDGTISGLTEPQLLDRFVASRDDAAFEAIVRRHGPAVMAVCRRLLVDSHEAEDAFQATFLVLARRAGGIRRSEPIGPWLVGVAYRIASKARVASARRRRREAVAAGRRPEQIAPIEPITLDLAPLIWDELHRLPRKYRDPIVLCWVEGHSHLEAAEQLRWPVGTVKGRLHRARETLRLRLSRRGVTAPAAGLSAWFSSEVAAAVVPPPLLGTTVKSALALAAGGALVAGTVPAGACLLAKGALRAMTLTTLSTSLAAVLVVGGTVASGWGALNTLDGAGTSPSAPASGPGRASPDDPDPSLAPVASNPASGVPTGVAGTAEGLGPSGPLDPPTTTQPAPPAGTPAATSGNAKELDVALARRHLDTVAKALAEGRTGADRYLAAMKLLLAARLDAAKNDKERLSALKEYRDRLQALRSDWDDLVPPTDSTMPRELTDAELALAEAAVVLGEQLGAMPRPGAAGMMGMGMEGMMPGMSMEGMMPGMGMSGMEGMYGMMSGGGRGMAMRGGGEGMTPSPGGSEDADPFADRTNNPASKAVKAKLDLPIAMPFASDTPIVDVLEYIRQATADETTRMGIPIYVDPEGIQEAEQSLDSPVVIDLEGIPLRTTLWLTLRQLNLAYTVIDGVLIISSSNHLEDMLDQEPIFRGRPGDLGRKDDGDQNEPFP